MKAARLVAKCSSCRQRSYSWLDPREVEILHHHGILMWQSRSSVIAENFGNRCDDFTNCRTFLVSVTQTRKKHACHDTQWNEILGLMNISYLKKEGTGTAPRIAMSAPFPRQLVSGVLPGLQKTFSPRKRTNTSIPDS